MGLATGGPGHRWPVADRASTTVATPPVTPSPSRRSRASRRRPRPARCPDDVGHRSSPACRSSPRPLSTTTAAAGADHRAPERRDARPDHDLGRRRHHLAAAGVHVQRRRRRPVHRHRRRRQLHRSCPTRTPTDTMPVETVAVDDTAAPVATDVPADTVVRRRPTRHAAEAVGKASSACRSTRPPRWPRQPAGPCGSSTLDGETQTVTDGPPDRTAVERRRSTTASWRTSVEHRLTLSPGRRRLSAAG